MLDQLKYSLQESIQKIDSSIELLIDDIEVSLLFDEKGDFTTNIALKLSKLLKQKPLDLAQLVIKNFSSKDFEKIEVAGPGFINFFLKDQSFLKLLNYEQKRFQDQSTVNIEFVSANPTGTLHLAHGRGAIVADVLSNLYEFLSSILYHISSIHNLALPYKQFYKGDYIQDLAEKCFENFKDIFKSKLISKEQELKIVNYAIEYLVSLS